MEQKKTSIFNNAMIWFGAAISIAEIITGTLIAPLGLYKGIIAILLGHLIGCTLLYLSGLIGAKTQKTAMETVKISFGEKGSMFFSLLNILQLVGWTAVMIIGGSKAAAVILNPYFHLQGYALWSVIICLFIILWIIVGIGNLTKINLVAMGALFVVTILLSFVIFKNNVPVQSATGEISFGLAVELSAAMPLSWLPLISDYTKAAEKPSQAAAVSTIVYFFTSCWMYVIGLGAAIFTGQSDIATIMMQAGLGMAAIIIIIFSTVTTTFLDVYSAGISFINIKKGNEKFIAVLICIIGTLLAIFSPIEQYENFLYFISSVFAPMIAILITDFYILKIHHGKETLNKTNLILWVIGFILYRILISMDTVIGSTLPVMMIISILCITLNGGKKYVQKHSRQS